MIGSQEKNCFCKMIKRGIALCLAVLTVVAMLPFAALDVAAAGSGDFTYAINDDGTATVADYTGSDTEVVIPEEIDGYKVTSIGDFVFYDCSALTSITIPEGVTSIGEYAFGGCTSLTSITIPDSVTSIGYSAFSDTAYYDNEDNWENGVLYIGNHLIKSKDTYSECIMKEGTITIADEAFYLCSSLTSVSIPESVTSIGAGAFDYCSSLTSVTIPSGVTSIGAWAFNGCYNIDTVYYNGTAEEWLNIKFANEYSRPNIFAESIYFGGEPSYEIVIPEGITEIPDDAFRNFKNLKSVFIPDNVTSIGTRAFCDCTSLTSVTIPSGVTSIGAWAFNGCYNIDTVYYNGTAEEWLNIKFANEYSRPNIFAESIYFGGEPSYEYEIVIPEGITEIPDDAFRNFKNLKSVFIPDNVTSIGTRAFCNCTSLASITISVGVASIGDQAFSGCSSLTSITIPEGVTSVGGWAFDDCSALTSITIPEGVASIGEYAFVGCSSLTSITIPKSVTSIGAGAFSGLGNNLYTVYYNGTAEEWLNIKFADAYSRPNIFAESIYFGGEPTYEIVIPDGITEIPRETFRNFKGLQSITIPGSVTTIGGRAFSGCSSLTSITIPDSVTSIGNLAFDECSALTSITIPEGVTSIGEYAFGWCSSLTSITIPKSVTSIGAGAFTGCYNIDTVYYNGTATEWFNIKFADEDSNPKQYANNICFVGEVSYEYEIVMPDGITNIPNYAFLNFKGLQSITIPDSVTSIGNLAFDGCGSLKAINVTSGNKYYSSEDGVLYNRDKTELICCPKGKTEGEFAIPDGVTSIGAEAFSDCLSLRSITIPKGVTSIGAGAFSSCFNLDTVYYNGTVKEWFNIEFVSDSSHPNIYAESIYFDNEPTYEIVIPDGITKIPDNAFRGFKGLQNITIPDSVTSIGTGAFYNCSSLKNITIPGSVTLIGSFAFCGCTSFTYISIPEGVTTIEYRAFDNCPALTSFSIPASVTSFEDPAFFEGSSLKAINVASENKIFSSEDGVLYNRNKTKLIRYPSGKSEREFTIPNSVTSIEGSAFYGCTALASITIPEGVISIGFSAFSGCTSLTGITIPDSVTSIEYAAFSGCTSLTSISISESVTSIGYYAFSECSSLTAINVASGNTCYSSEDGILYNHDKTVLMCFPEGKSEKKFAIPDGVLAIDNMAFNNCHGLSNVTIPESVTYVGYNAFHGCSSLTSISIPESVTSIGYNAFYGCSSLTAINVASGNTCYSSEDGILYNYDKTVLIRFPEGKSEKVFTIPDGVTSIESYAFADCTNLTKVTVPSSVTGIGCDAFYHCPSLEIITISPGVTSIEACTFSDCTALTSIMIPEGVTSIEDYTFAGCTALTKVTIPSSVTWIASSAFLDCSSLEKIYFSGTESEWKRINKNGNDFNGAKIVFNCDFELSSNDIRIEALKTALSEEAKLSVSVVNDGEAKDGVLENLAGNYATDDGVLYDISVLLEGQKIQPTGKVTVYIPVPAGKDGESCKIFHIADDGTVTDMNAVYEDGHMVFSTDHFSYYALVEEAYAAGDVDGDGRITSKDLLALKKYLQSVLSEDAAFVFGAADVDVDGIVTTKDLLKLKRLLIGVE